VNTACHGNLSACQSGNSCRRFDSPGLGYRMDDRITVVRLPVAKGPEELCGLPALYSMDTEGHMYLVAGKTAEGWSCMSTLLNVFMYRLLCFSSRYFTLHNAQNFWSWIIHILAILLLTTSQNNKVKVKDSRNRPCVVQRVPTGSGSQISMTFGIRRWWGCQPIAPAAFTPRNVPGTHFH
jgi:hypothetical protein